MSVSNLKYSISRRGAEEAELAEGGTPLRSRFSAASASSASLRETNNAPFGAGVEL